MRNMKNQGKLIVSAVVIVVFMVAGFFIILKNKSNSEPTKQEKATLEIRSFMNDDSLKIQYANESKFAYDENIDEDIYISEFDQFEVNSKTGEILQFGPKPSVVGGKQKAYDYSNKYTEAELEKMAKDFITSHNPKIKLNELIANGGNKEETNYFFRWEDRTRRVDGAYPFIEVGFTNGGSILSYVNALDIDKNNN